MRRGMTVEALKNFMLEQGPSKNTNLQEWDKIWSMNKSVIDPVAPRYTAIVKSTACKLIVENGPEEIECQSHPLHQKNPAIGSKAVVYGKQLWIEKDDAASIEVGEKVTLMKWGNVTITKKDVSPEGEITLYGKVDVEDKDFKGTKKLTWIAADDATTLDVTLIELDHLITKKKLEETDDVKDHVNKNSKIEYDAIAEGSMRNLSKGDIIQLERRGYFYVDSISLGDRKIRLNFIPDGKTSRMSTISHVLDAKMSSKGEATEGQNFANKAQAKKAKGEANGGEAGADTQATTGAEGEGEKKGPSKKDLKKAAKKEEKKKGKDGKPEGEG
jgi:glutamyl-tRNA synthetase